MYHQSGMGGDGNAYCKNGTADNDAAMYLCCGKAKDDAAYCHSGAAKDDTVYRHGGTVDNNTA